MTLGNDGDRLICERPSSLALNTHLKQEQHLWDILLDLIQQQFEPQANDEVKVGLGLEEEDRKIKNQMERDSISKDNKLSYPDAFDPSDTNNTNDTTDNTDISLKEKKKNLTIYTMFDESYNDNADYDHYDSYYDSYNDISENIFEFPQDPIPNTSGYNINDTLSHANLLPLSLAF